MPQEISFTQPSGNTYFSEEDSKKSKLAYYGEFLLMSNFDDGWKENMYTKFKNFCTRYHIDSEKLKKDDIHFQLFEETEKYNDNIMVILSLEETSENSETDLLKLTTQLQQDFSLTPIVQSTNYALELASGGTNLPIEVKEPGRSSKHYHRYRIQKEKAKILSLSNDIQKNKHLLIKISEKEEDITQQAIISAIKNMIETYEVQIKNLEQDLLTSVENYYIEKVLQPQGTQICTSLSSFQANAILDLDIKTKDTDVLRFSEYVSQVKNVFDTQNQQVQIDQKELQELIHSFFTKVQKITPQIQLSHSSEIQQIQFGIIDAHSIEEKNGEIVRGSFIFGEHNFYNTGKYITGLQLQGIDVIEKLTHSRISEASTIESFHVHSEGKVSLYYAEDEEYIPLTIDQKRQFHSLGNLHYGKKATIIPSSGYVNYQEDTQSYFYTQDKVLIFLSLNDEDQFKKINIDSSYKNKTPLNGSVTNLDNSISYFYRQKNKLKLLEINEKFKFLKVNIDLSDDKNIPLSGTIFNDDNTRSYFFKKNGKYKLLEVSGESHFKKIKDGCLTHTNGNTSYFHKTEDNNHTVLEVRGETIFSDVSIEKDNDYYTGIFKIKSKGIYLHRADGGTQRLYLKLKHSLNKYSLTLKEGYGILKYGSSEEVYFHFGKGKSNIIEIDGKSIFNSYEEEIDYGDPYIGYEEPNEAHFRNIDLIFNDSKELIGGKVSPREKKGDAYFSGSDGKYTYFKLKDGQYIFSGYQNKIYQDKQTGKPIRGFVRVKGTNDFIYFYQKKLQVGRSKMIEYNSTKAILLKNRKGTSLENGKQIYIREGKILEIDGEVEFNAIYDIMFHSANNDKIDGKIKNDNNSVSYFYSTGSMSATLLKIEGKSEFLDVQTPVFNKEGVPTKGVVQLKSGAQVKFILENETYIFVEQIEENKKLPKSTFKNQDTIITLDMNRNPNYNLGFDHSLQVDDKGLKKYCYNSNGKSIFLEIEKKMKFIDISIYKVDLDYKPILGEITHENGKKSLFYFKNNTYKYLEIEGIKQFKRIKNILIFEQTGEVQNGTVAIRHSMIQKKFHKKGDSYVFT